MLWVIKAEKTLQEQHILCEKQNILKILDLCEETNYLLTEAKNFCFVLFLFAILGWGNPCKSKRIMQTSSPHFVGGIFEHLFQSLAMNLFQASKDEKSLKSSSSITIFFPFSI